MDSITVEELRERLDELVLVEALPPENFRRRHLPGAVNIPKDRVDELAPLLLPERDAEIVVYCASRSCVASRVVARRLEELGYANVRELEGGKHEWFKTGLPFARA